LNPRNVYAAVRSYVDNAPRKVQFIHEFIQNAEDAGARRCRFEFYDDRIVVRNDGQAFSPANLYAICSFRESDKANVDLRRLIGKFGVGFKSVFRICPCPLLVSCERACPRPLPFRFFVPASGTIATTRNSNGRPRSAFLPKCRTGSANGFTRTSGTCSPCRWSWTRRRSASIGRSVTDRR